jgi:hypothetical protein
MTKAISFEYQFVVPRDKSGNPIFEKVKNFNLITLGFGDHIISYLGRK